MRGGVRLGIDVGTVRVGVAISDPDGILASPLVTLARDEQTVAEVVHLVHERGVSEVFVGLPISLAGQHTRSTGDAIEFADSLHKALSLPVHLVDERLTTVSANAALQRSGKKASRSRSVVDQVAAVMLLQHALDSERVSGRLPGFPVETWRREVD